MIAKKTIVVLGGGAAGIMTALQLSDRFNVYLIEQKKTLGRKLLVAGNGGFNLTNNTTQSELISKYEPANFLEQSLNEFSANDLRNFLSQLGIETFVGSSNRVFPIEGVKPVQVLNALISQLSKKGVQVLLNHKVIQLTQNTISILNDSKKEITLNFDYCVLALGGASWSKTGSEGKWVDLFKDKRVQVNPFEASNCGVNINWSPTFIQNHEGKPLKNIALTINDFKIKGEALITNYGLEGNAIYPIVREVRRSLNKNVIPVLNIDFKPKNTAEELFKKIKGIKSSHYSRTLNLSAHEMALIKQFTTKAEFLDAELFIAKVKKLAISIHSIRPVEEAISTVGGIALESLNHNFSLKQFPSIYTIGEMVDWDAPTGGYLLQGCFSMAYRVSSSINSRLV